MDIFTTQLARVVQTPIKPANLKVKALLKESGAGKLKEDLDHLENHDYYFEMSEEASQHQQEEQADNQEKAKSQEKADSNANKQTVLSDDEKIEAARSALKAKHLDLYA